MHSPVNWGYSNDFTVTLGNFDGYIDEVRISKVARAFKAEQRIAQFTAAPFAGTYGGTAALHATGGDSGNPVRFAAATPEVCAVSGKTVIFLAAGTCTVTADQAGNAVYDAAPQATLNIGVGKLGQTIAAIGFAHAPLIVGGTTQASATASSGLPVSFGTTTPSICATDGNGLVTGIAVGNCAVVANQAGSAAYDAARPRIKYLAVRKAN
ncbi:hypothetical protein [Methylomagnum ishizawai]|uniref:hypothetical protein n=1 Tax=Methylomagnum ishizawai TaxID=1760988 RepID=UPI001C33B764|nr:hypothetical protein [Methylomagnum ishizawai]BBL77295.1 hypothetical protein MishRS11D_43930 [Methylomagnum ishizawai]